jgi:hypothetical protein
MRIGEYHIENVPLEEAMHMRKLGAAMYDYTKLTAVNTCPTWGVVRYALHKTEIPMMEGGRNLAIECGKACHDYFAALRMWTLIHPWNAIAKNLDMPTSEKVPELSAYGEKLFGKVRWESMLDVSQDSDPVNNAQLFSLDALHTSGYYDDPRDTRRTMTNMESSCLVYTDRYFKSNMPVHINEDKIGIEIPFVLRVTRVTDETVVYYCGKIDGVHEWENELVVAENKTASRLSDSWRMSFAISHQVTGYIVAASEIFQRDISQAIVMGVQIPLPKDIFTGTSFELCTRTLSDKERWCEWLFHSVHMYDLWLHMPEMAPRYSHSCNRFFHSCMFIPYCSLPRDEQTQALADMSVNEWSPLDHVVDKPVLEGE